MGYSKFLALASIIGSGVICAEIKSESSANVLPSSAPSAEIASANVMPSSADSSEMSSLLKLPFKTQASAEDQAESKIIYQRAKKVLEQGESKKAVLEFSEILEFFPNTESWPLACLSLTAIYRLDKNIHSAQVVLNRLTAHPIFSQSFRLEILFVRWDFLSLPEQFQDLSKFLNELSVDEKKQLRVDQRTKERFIHMIQEDKILLNNIIALWSKLDHPSPLHAMSELLSRDAGFLFNKQQSGLLLDCCLQEKKTDLIESISLAMGQNGWADQAQRQFVARQADPENSIWRGIWLRFLIQHQLYSQALELIPINNDNYSTELCLTHIGLKNWDRAAQIVIAQADWISSAIPYDEMLKCTQGLASQSQYRLLLDDFLKILRAPLQKMLKTEILPSNRERLEKCSQIFAEDSVYGPRAGLLLAKMHLAQRDLTALIKLKDIVGQRYPSANHLIIEVQTSIGILQALQKDSPINVQQP